MSRFNPLNLSVGCNIGIQLRTGGAERIEKVKSFAYYGERDGYYIQLENGRTVKQGLDNVSIVLLDVNMRPVVRNPRAGFPEAVVYRADSSDGPHTIDCRETTVYIWRSARMVGLGLKETLGQQDTVSDFISPKEARAFAKLLVEMAEIAERDD